MGARSGIAGMIKPAVLACMLVSTSWAAAQGTNETLYFERVFGAIRRNFPADFDRIAIASHGPNAATESGRMISDLFKTHRPDIGHAPATSLLAIVAAERDFIVALQRHSDGLCSIYGETGDVSHEDLTTAAASLGLEMGVRKWDAARAGIDHRVERSLGKLTPQDAQVWLAAMRKSGASDHLIDLVAGDAKASGVSPMELCQAYVIEISSIASMPPETGAKIAAIRYATEDGLWAYSISQRAKARSGR